MKLALLLLLATATGRAAQPPACTASQLTLSTDGENGNYNGMSHSGTLLILRNIGEKACTVPGIPVLTFQDAHHQPVAIERQVPPFMHPGPVVLPAIIAPGAEVTADIRWVSGDAYGANNCPTLASASITISGQTLTTPFPATICGPAGRTPTYTMGRLHPDPVYTPGRS